MCSPASCTKTKADGRVSVQSRQEVVGHFESSSPTISPAMALRSLGVCVSGQAWWRQLNTLLVQGGAGLLALLLATSCTTSLWPSSTVPRKPDVILHQADYSGLVLLDPVKSRDGLISFDEAVAIAVRVARNDGWLKDATSVQAFLGVEPGAPASVRGGTVYRVIFANVPFTCSTRGVVTVDARTGEGYDLASMCP
jgi:hypothetical protein